MGSGAWPGVDILAVIPAYNEAKNIASVVTKTRAQGLSVLVIDDGSSDGTAEAARAAGAEVVSNRHNIGLGRTMRRAYEEALKRNVDIVVQLDADGQYDPAEIPLLLAPIQSGKADMVLGARLGNLRYKMPFTKKLGNEAFSAVLRSLTGQDVRDGQTGFRAIHRDVLERCLPINTFSYTQEMIIRAAKEGFVVQSVETTFHARYDEHSRLFRSPFSFAFRAGWIILRTWRDYHPMPFFGIPGLLFLLMSAYFAVISLVYYLHTGLITGRVGSLITGGVLFLFGVQLFFTGMVADMIRTHTSGLISRPDSFRRAR
jgi:glycosyltransferase involved in cell wall biosynthesis